MNRKGEQEEDITTNETGGRMTEEMELASNAQWEHETSAEIRIKRVEGHAGAISCCQLIRDDQVIFTASNDKTVRLWQFDTGRQMHIYPNLHKENIPCAKVNHNNTKFVTCSWDKSVKCWDLETGKLLWTNMHEFLVTSVAFSPDGDFVVSASDIDLLVKVWDTHTGQLVDTIQNLHKSTITSCQFTQKNDRIVTTSMDRTCKFYDLTAKCSTITLGSHTGVISNCSFSSDERTFATCSWDKTIQVWDIATGTYRKNGATVLDKVHIGSVSTCFINADSSLCASGGYDTRVVLWDLVYSTPKLVLRGHTDWVNDVVITKDNKWIVSVGNDKTIRQWGIVDSDDIKLVVEQNRTLGNKLINCSKCHRPFKSTKLEKTDESKLQCVFCRRRY